MTVAFPVQPAVSARGAGHEGICSQQERNQTASRATAQQACKGGRPRRRRGGTAAPGEIETKRPPAPMAGPW
jgi:hypothetical protein